MENDGEEQRHDRVKGVNVPYRRLNRLLLQVSSKNLTIQQKIIAVTIVTSIIIASSIVGLSSGMNVIFPHFFYLPIIMTVYWFPNRGVAFSIGLAILYVSEFLFFGLVLETIPMSEWINVVSRSIVFITIGTVLTMLRWEAFTLNRIIGDQDKFVFMFDKDLGYFYFSPSAYEMVRAANNEDHVAYGIRSIVSYEDRQRFDEDERRALRGEKFVDKLRITDVDSRQRTYNFCFIPLLNGEKAYGYEAIAEDVTDIEDYEVSLEKAVMEKTTLLAEVHHRVRNNLASIIGLINMQIRETDHPEARKSLLEFESRLLAISSVHSQIYEGDDIINIDFEDHMCRLMDDILESSPQKDRLEVQIEGNGVRINHWAIMDISTVVAELVTNSVKHAFPEGGGEIEVRLESQEDSCILSISDNGIGLAQEFDIESQGRLGLKIVRRIVEDKFKGKLSWRLEGGTKWTIRFPCTDDDFRICTRRKS